MGVVYTAYDPELDRRIALKLLHPGETGEGRPRLVREAQAIARIAHPNVVAVHDVGELDGSVFVAMELIDGLTLRKWLRQGDHDRSEIIDILRQAGRGLAAAHQAELVHRDFKPDNVMVGHDGRVRVLDFGLARGYGSAESLAARDEVSNVSLDTTLTAAGTVVGTPAYMSPEQLGGKLADFASDQFAFCVVLFEALYGIRPFAGTNIEVLAITVRSGKIRSPPPGHSVPTWLHRIVARGLELDAADRYPSMEALLQDLAHDPGHRARRNRSVLAVAGGAALVATLPYRSGSQDERSSCETAAAPIDVVWNEQRDQSLAAAFEATALPHATDTWERVSAFVDDYVREWSELGQPDEALVQAERAIELLDADDGRPTDSLDARRIKGRSERELGDISASLATLEEALQHASTRSIDDLRWTELRFELARTLAVTGQQRRAIEIATRARDDLEELGHLHADATHLLENIDQWLAAVAAMP